MDRAQNMPGDFEKNGQIDQILQRQQSEGDRLRGMVGKAHYERAYTYVVQHAEGNVKGEDREGLELTAHYEHDQQANLSQDEKEIKCRIKRLQAHIAPW